MTIAIKMDNETKEWLCKLREEHGEVVYNQFLTETNMYNEMGFRANGEVPEEYSINIPRKKYNGYLFIPNFYEIGDEVIEYCPGWNISRRGTVIKIVWKLRFLDRKPYLLPSYKIKWEDDGSFSWKFEYGLL